MTSSAYDFYIADVFSNTRYGGNPLAVLPAASGLDTAQMQRIAREFNFSESAFVFPANDGGDAHVRIFTPTTEVPFAGHPNIGTAFVLASIGAFGDLAAPHDVVFEELAGNVAIRVEPRGDGRYWCELLAPQALTIGDDFNSHEVANALCLSAADIKVDVHPPTISSVGLPFTIVELASVDALRRASINPVALDHLQLIGANPDIHCYVRSKDEFDIRARMFAPLDGVPEDPATGSANCALVGLLAHYDEAPDAQVRFNIAQGVEMGRPSLLQARYEKRSGQTCGIWIGGESVLFANGQLRP